MLETMNEYAGVGEDVTMYYTEIKSSWAGASLASRCSRRNSSRFLSLFLFRSNLLPLWPSSFLLVTLTFPKANMSDSAHIKKTFAVPPSPLPSDYDELSTNISEEIVSGGSGESGVEDAMYRDSGLSNENVPREESPLLPPRYSTSCYLLHCPSPSVF